MKELTNHDLQAINNAHTGPMVSIYLSKDAEEIHVKRLSDKWKDSLSHVEFLLAKDYTKSFIHNFMKPLWESHIVETLNNIDKGLIVFFSEEIKGFLRVQSSVTDLAVVADSFHVKPLFRIKNNERGYFLISMSTKAINVFIESNGHLFRIDTYRNSTLLEQVDIDGNKHKQDKHRDFIIQSAIEINKTIAQYKLPIILAGVRDHIGHMKKNLDHSMIIEESIIGNIEKLQRDEIRMKCFELLKPYYYKKEQEAIKELNLAVKKDQAITYIEDIAVSAVYGKVRKLYVMEDKHLWGSINKLTGEILISPRQSNSHDDDILDDICQMVISKGGEVLVLKDTESIKGYVAAAIVSDKSHLYDYRQPFFSP